MVLSCLGSSSALLVKSFAGVLKACFATFATVPPYSDPALSHSLGPHSQNREEQSAAEEAAAENQHLLSSTFASWSSIYMTETAKLIDDAMQACLILFVVLFFLTGGHLTNLGEKILSLSLFQAVSVS